MTTRTLNGRPLTPGHNVDAVDIEAGLTKLAQLGYTASTHQLEIEYNLTRWQRGEEEQADHSMAQSLSGVNYTDWRVILAAAISADERNVPPSSKP